jgi:predicted outer membrane repeat protein
MLVWVFSSLLLRAQLDLKNLDLNNKERGMRKALVRTVVAVLLALPASVSAVTIYVPADCPTIQGGVDAASSGDTVMVACDTYYQTAQTWVETSGICLRSETGEADCVTIDGQNTWPGFMCANLDSTTTIMGFTFTNCGDAGPASAIIVDGGAPELRNLVFTGNSYPMFVSGDPTLVNLHFVDNTGTARSTYESNLKLIDVLFERNSTAASGGGMYCWGGAPVLQNVVFEDNSAALGGGMYLEDASPVLSDVTFLSNSADLHGGGLFGAYASGPDCSDVEFLNNVAHGSGGGIYCRHGCSPTLTDVLMRGNQAYGSGGGMMCIVASPTLIHVTLAHDYAYGGPGGGLYCEGPIAPSLTNVTIVGCDAADGSAIYLSDDANATIENSIIAFNTWGLPISCANASSAQLSCCDVYDNVGGYFPGCITGQGGANGNFAADPDLCSSFDPELSTGSPCLPGAQPDCGLIGALGVGCPTTTVPESSTETTWGTIKAMFR